MRRKNEQVNRLKAETEIRIGCKSTFAGTDKKEKADEAFKQLESFNCRGASRKSGARNSLRQNMILCRHRIRSGMAKEYMNFVYACKNK